MDMTKTVTHECPNEPDGQVFCPTCSCEIMTLKAVPHFQNECINALKKELSRLSRIEDKYVNLCAVLNEQAGEIQRLKQALAFWLPGVPSSGSGRATRCGNDAMLLVSYAGRLEPGAQDLGWITFRYADIP